MRLDVLVALQSAVQIEYSENAKGVRQRASSDGRNVCSLKLSRQSNEQRNTHYMMRVSSAR